MRWFDLGETECRDTDQLVAWFEQQGYPPTDQPRPHLMWIRGQGWQVQMGYDTGVVNKTWAVGISDPHLELLFILKWCEK